MCVCVCVTENRNLCKGTAVRFSQTGSTGQRKRILERPFLRKNFHSDRVSRWKFPDNSSQWKALLVCLCHLFKIRTIWGQIREPAGPICSFAEISAPWVNTTKFNFLNSFPGFAGLFNKGNEPESCNRVLTLINSVKTWPSAN